MNAVGKFGEFVIEYQDGLEAGLLAVLAIIILVWIIRLIARSSKRTDVLDEMNDKITRIDSEVKDISSKQEAILSGAVKSKAQTAETEARNAAEPATEAKAETTAETGAEEKAEPAAEPGAAAKDGTAADPNAETKAETAAEPGAETGPAAETECGCASDGPGPCGDDAPAKYTSRDCGTDKHGKIYTIEILNEKIR